MKKLMSFALAMMLCLSAAALAENVPSKNTGDMTQFEVTVENAAGDTKPMLAPVTAQDAQTPEQQAKVERCEQEIAKLNASASIESYFGEVKNSEGETVDLKAVLGTETLNVFEFCPVMAEGFAQGNGQVTAKLAFSTPYDKGQKVVVMIGIVTTAADGSTTVTWHAFEGVGLGEVQGEEATFGGIEVVLSEDIVLAIQNGEALMAVVSK